MVFVRYVLNQNTIWQTDFVTWSLVAATFVGSPYLLLTRGHVNVEVLPIYLGPRKRYWLGLPPLLMSLAVCIVVTGPTPPLLLAAPGERPGAGTTWRAPLWGP